jgi:transposase-like protein
VTAAGSSYKGFRFPPEIISQCVWLYHRFPLSFREVEELMLVRGVLVSYETIRQWCAKFGPEYACRLRHRQPRPGDKWHLDEVFLTISGRRHYLWRAVDQDGNVLDILVQPRREAAKRFFRKLLTEQCRVPRVAGHRQAPRLSGGASGGDAVGRAPALAISELIHTEFAGPGHHLGNLIGAARVQTSGVLSVWVAGYRTLGRAPC